MHSRGMLNKIKLYVLLSANSLYHFFIHLHNLAVVFVWNISRALSGIGRELFYFEVISIEVIGLLLFIF